MLSDINKAIYNSRLLNTLEDSNQFRDDLNHFITSTNYLMDGNIIKSIHLYVDDSHYNVVSQHSNSPLFCPLSDTYYLAHASIPESIPSTQKFQRLTFVDEAV